MARGWESKSIEEQQAEAREKKSLPKYRLSAAQVAQVRELEGLRLARASVLQQMSAAKGPRHFDILQQALAELDQKMQALQEKRSDSTVSGQNQRS